MRRSPAISNLSEIRNQTGGLFLQTNNQQEIIEQETKVEQEIKSEQNLHLTILPYPAAKVKSSIPILNPSKSYNK